MASTGEINFVGFGIGPGVDYEDQIKAAARDMGGNVELLENPDEAAVRLVTMSERGIVHGIITTLGICERPPRIRPLGVMPGNHPPAHRFLEASRGLRVPGLVLTSDSRINRYLTVSNHKLSVISDLASPAERVMRTTAWMRRMGSAVLAD